MDSRQGKILHAVIEEYIQTAEPVGSAVLTQKYRLECSSATIRNEMARLEEQGFLTQPHTSAGRVPQDKAYRFYVDHLLAQRIHPPPEASTIDRQLEDKGREVEALVDHARHLLSQMTRYTALVLGPRLGRSLFKYLQLVPVGEEQILLVMMTHTGSLVHRLIEVSAPIAAEDLSRMTNMLNDRLRGLALDSITVEFLRSMPEPLDPDIMQRVTETTRELSHPTGHRIVFEGAANLLDQPEFRDVQKARALLEVLEQEKLLAEIMDKSLSDSGIEVVIGSENPLSEMHDCTMVTATYQVGGVPVGSLGVLGPTRLPYERIISLVECFSHLFSVHLARVSR